MTYVHVNTAYSLVKDFAKHGGAILAVDVESWDQDHDVSGNVNPHDLYFVGARVFPNASELPHSSTS